MSILDLMALATRINASVLGVPIIVTRSTPDDGAIETRGIWSGPPDENQPYGTDRQRLDPRRVMTIVATTELTDVPRGSKVLAAEKSGAAARLWRVDGYAGVVRPETIPVLLVPLSDVL